MISSIFSIFLWSCAIGFIVGFILWVGLIWLGSREQIEDHDNLFESYEEDRR